MGLNVGFMGRNHGFIGLNIGFGGLVGLNIFMRLIKGLTGFGSLGVLRVCRVYRGL